MCSSSINVGLYDNFLQALKLDIEVDEDKISDGCEKEQDSIDNSHDEAGVVDDNTEDNVDNMSCDTEDGPVDTPDTITSIRRQKYQLDDRVRDQVNDFLHF